MATTRIDPYFGYNFAVELDGITSMGFKGCTGLDSSTNSTKYREGTDASLAQRELPALLHHSAVTLTRGITQDHALWDWRNDIVNGKRGVTANTALRLARYFGNSPEFWLNLQAAHDLRAAEREAAVRIEREVSPRKAAA